MRARRRTPRPRPGGSEHRQLPAGGSGSSTVAAQPRTTPTSWRAGRDHPGLRRCRDRRPRGRHRGAASSSSDRERPDAGDPGQGVAAARADPHAHRRVRRGAGGASREALSLLLPRRGIDDLGLRPANRGNVHLQRGRRTPLAAADFEAARDELDRARPRRPARQGRAQPRLRPAARRRPGRGAPDDRRGGRGAGAAVRGVNRATVEQDRAEILTAAGRPREAPRH